MDHIAPVSIISEDAVNIHLPMDKCISLMRDLFVQVAAGKVVNPLRTFVPMQDGAIFGSMPCALTTPSNETYCGTKLVTLCPKNPSPVPSIQGVIILFGQSQLGQPLAMIEASSVTAIRTAAASGLATDTLARSDAKICAIIGTGVQAESHAEAMLCVRPQLEKLLITGRSASRCDMVVKRLTQRYKTRYPSLTIVAADSIAEAVQEADIICTVTAAATPILMDEMIKKPGVHINAVGAHGKNKREIDGKLMKRACIWADLNASTLAEGGDFLIPMEEGLFDASHLKGDLSELVSNAKKGRQNEQEITIFNSLGIAVEDLQCAIHLYKSVKESSANTPTPSARLMSRL